MNLNFQIIYFFLNNSFFAIEAIAVPEHYLRENRQPKEQPGPLGFIIMCPKPHRKPIMAPLIKLPFDINPPYTCRYSQIKKSLEPENSPSLGSANAAKVASCPTFGTIPKFSLIIGTKGFIVPTVKLGGLIYSPLI
ncbi:MAG: hypothetical protein Ct9H90mP2_11860 [Dehalococcoidia bacterium]|nr:MAG: hypothetical protein Ct9H90mP2_11860 [Dehalococcoidia bacterium]